MWFELVADIAKLSLYVACAFAALHAYAHRRQPEWTQPLMNRRLAVLGVLTLVVTGIKVFEDVLAKESGPADEAILWFVRHNVPPTLAGFFGVVTQTGSAKFLLPIALVAAAGLLVARRRFEAVLLGVSAIAASLVSFALKMLVGRIRPALWESQWYWGSSFPSGHTLSTAAISTAAALCIARIWPRAGRAAMSLAVLWTCLVAISRLVLGVHWPTDVLAAACLGFFIPLVTSLAFDVLRRDAATGTAAGG